MIYQGNLWCVGDNIDTDMIIAGQYLNTNDPAILGRHCMETLSENWADQVNNGDILVAGNNFGCGSSREHAPVALKAAGIACVIAGSFGAIFFRNAINVGLPIVELADAPKKLAQGETARADLNNNRIDNLTTGETYTFSPIAPIVRAILSTGGLLPYIKAAQA